VAHRKLQTDRRFSVARAERWGPTWRGLQKIDSKTAGTGMIALGKVYTEKGKHRLHERINTLLVVTSSIGVAFSLIRDRKADLTPGGLAIFECIQLNMEVAVLPFMGSVEAAIKDTILEKIELDFRPRTKPPNPAGSSGFKIAIDQSVAAFFGEFYAAYKAWLDKNISTDPYQWPSVLNFARVIRNSCAHGGIICFDNPSAKSVKWHNLEYSPSDNGRPVLFNDMAVGDFIVLMFEMSQELDNRGCPII
jgi:hypothetical protein